ncbi:MAG: ABC transporter ATP-binding protein [Proteobacteria bacterium]|nr:ABC transporter ATP-binding protein [Pseudomonadota bacterium]
MSDPIKAGAASVPLVEVKGLWKRFTSGEREIEVLRGIDFTLEAGDRVAIVGQSGIGKSTFLHVLGGLDRPTAGSVHFRGEDLFAKKSDELAEFRNHALGFVFQFHHLLPEFSAVENVMMPGLLRGLGFAEMRERAASILREVELAERLDHRVGKLSGGERQRVALARALVLDPTLVLADEPTGNLDPATGGRIGELLLEMNRTRGTALVVVTHNERLASLLGRTLSMEAGVLVAARPTGM